MQTFTVHPVGVVNGGGEGPAQLRIDPAYRDGLRGLEGFGHAVVTWWAHEVDDPELRALVDAGRPYARLDHDLGISPHGARCAPTRWPSRSSSWLLWTRMSASWRRPTSTRLTAPPSSTSSPTPRASTASSTPSSPPGAPTGLKAQKPPPISTGRPSSASSVTKSVEVTSS